MHDFQTIILVIQRMNVCFSRQDVSCPLPEKLMEAIKVYNKDFAWQAILMKERHVDNRAFEGYFNRLFAAHLYVFFRFVEKDHAKLPGFLETVRLLMLPSLLSIDQLDTLSDLILFPLFRNRAQYDGSCINTARMYLLNFFPRDSLSAKTSYRYQHTIKLGEHLLNQAISIYLRELCNGKLHERKSSSGSILDDRLELSEMGDFIRLCGEKRPAMLFQALNAYIVQTEYRYESLRFLLTLVRMNSSCLNCVGKEKTLDELLACLLQDRNESIVELALHCVIAILPHVVRNFPVYIERLLLVYRRLVRARYWCEIKLRWRVKLDNEDEVDDKSYPIDNYTYFIQRWNESLRINREPDVTMKISEELPLDLYFSLLYTIIPRNFMWFIHCPRDMLRSINAQEELEWGEEGDQISRVVREKSEEYIQMNGLHVGLIKWSIEEELDKIRFEEMSPREIIADCLNYNRAGCNPGSGYYGTIKPKRMPINYCIGPLKSGKISRSKRVGKRLTGRGRFDWEFYRNSVLSGKLRQSLDLPIDDSSLDRDKTDIAEIVSDEIKELDYGMLESESICKYDKKYAIKRSDSEVTLNAEEENSKLDNRDIWHENELLRKQIDDERKEFRHCQEKIIISCQEVVLWAQKVGSLSFTGRGKIVSDFSTIDEEFNRIKRVFRELADEMETTTLNRAWNQCNMELNLTKNITIDSKLTITSDNTPGQLSQLKQSCQDLFVRCQRLKGLNTEPS